MTIDGVSHPLPDPFLVLATQNPVEYEGTYPLPEAQRDRFLVHVAIGYPEAERGARDAAPRPPRPRADRRSTTSQPVASAEDLRAARAEVDATEVHDEVVGYVVAIVRRTRELPSVVARRQPARRRPPARRGQGRRAARRPRLRDARTTSPAWPRPVLRHRLVLTPEAELERATPMGAIRAALEDVPVPR